MNNKDVKDLKNNHGDKDLYKHKEKVRTIIEQFILNGAAIVPGAGGFPRRPEGRFGAYPVRPSSGGVKW